MLPELLPAAAQIALVLLIAPALQGVIKRVKAFWQNRHGPPLLQAYADLRKLASKETIAPEPTSWLFTAAPTLVFAATVAACALVPMVAPRPPWSGGDAILLVGLLALARFALALAALDTGSAFAGMGASREMAIAALVEPALLLGLFALAVPGGSTDLGALSRAGLAAGPAALGPAHLLAFGALLIVAIAETGRLPVDNPDTHLELTMVHEGMLLEYSGRPLAVLVWAALTRQMLVLSLIAALLLPWGLDAPLPLALAAFLAKLLLLGVLLACIETAYAKLRILRLPELLATACGLGGLSLVAHSIFGG